MAQATNVTKHTAGGSGDNVIADGYIKAVEKVWLDSYTIAFTNTNTTIDVAVIPANKKITGIDVMVYSSASQTGGTISVGYSTDSAVDTFFGPANVTAAITLSTVSLFGGNLSGTLGTSLNSVGKLGGFQAVTSGTATTISVKLNNWTMTTGTVKTIVRYT
jgi:hypothetical protein